MKYSRIVSTGMAVPNKILTNHDIAKMVDTSDEWIMTRTGIRERHVVEGDEATSDLAYRAAKQALDGVRMDPTEVEAILLATITPDMIFPASACVVQSKLGAKRAMAMDMSAACSGYLYALSVADAYIRSGMYRTILVIGAEAMTRFLDWEDRGSCILFGDGAGATLVVASDEPGIRYFELGADGHFWDLIHVPAGGSKMPATHETIDQRLHYARLNGKEVYKLAVKYATEMTERALRINQLEPEDIHLVVPHQANQRITEAVRERLNIPPERVMSNIDRYGNTSGATIPICLHEAVKGGRLKKGDTVLMLAFGAGFTWGSALVTW